MEIKIWILTVAIGVLAIILWWMLRLAIRGIYKRLDELIKQNNTYGRQLVKQGSDITALKLRVSSSEKRLDNHADRIRNIEINRK